VGDGQVTAIHAVRENGLRMQGIEHIDAIRILIIGIEVHEPRASLDAGVLEHPAQGYSGPFGNR